MNMRSCDCDTKTCGKKPDVDELSSVLKLVSEPNRLRLLWVLEDGGAHCVCEFSEHLPDMSQSLLSHHLADLRDAGLVMAEKKGAKVYYQLTERGGATIKTVLQLQ